MSRGVKRLCWAGGFLAVVAVEVIIGTFVRGGAVRQWLGDVLAALALCLGARILWPEGAKALPLAVFALAVLVEIMQGMGWPHWEFIRSHRALAIALGGTFDPVDIACYAVGCLIAWGIDELARIREKHT